MQSTTLASQSLQDANYLADFSAVPMERTRVLQISHTDYAEALQRGALIRSLQRQADELADANSGLDAENDRGVGVQAAAAAAAAPRRACRLPHRS